MNNIGIHFEHVGKLYQLGTVGTGTFSHDLNRWWQTTVLRRPDPYLKVGEVNDRSRKGNSDFVWALHDISFDVEQGDVVGIIGKNGAGKSTLLKLLSRVTAPTTGVIRARGRIASLLEVGTGFHPEMTGRENIYMNGSIMGMTRSEIARKLDEIVDFAGVERYLDTPVKRYSSGMMVRLGFAVAAFLEPEILVVDEVLAVGDAEFQKKAIGKMHDVSKGGGRTVLFVSHNMAAVQSLCRSGVVLENGCVSYIGTASDAIRNYLKSNQIKDAGDKIIDRVKFVKPGLRIDSIRFNGTDGCESTIVANQELLEVELEGYADDPLTTDLMVLFRTEDEMPMAVLSEGHYRGKLLKFPAGQFKISKRIKLPKFVGRGKYNVDINLHHPMMEWQMRAPGCVSVYIQGSQEGTGLSVHLETGGFLGLETVD